MTAVAVALTVVAGLAGAVQAAVMGRLGERVGVFPALAFAAIVGVLLSLALLLVVKQSFQGVASAARQPVWLWTGGALGTLVILGITVAAPRLGVTATIGILIALNLAVGTVIDRFGLFGFDRIAVGWPRVLGLALLGLGAALTLSESA